MKKSKIEKISLKDFLEQGTFLLYKRDSAYFSIYHDFINTFMKIHKQNIISSELKDFLLQNEDKIDKGKFIFCEYRNLKSLVEYMKDSLNEEMMEIKNRIRDCNIKDNKISRLFSCKDINEFKRILNNNLSRILINPEVDQELRKKLYEFNAAIIIKEEREKDLKKCELLLRNQDIILEDIDVEGRYAEMEIVSSREEIDKEKIPTRNKLNILNEIDKADKATGKGLRAIVQLIKPEDFIHLIPDVILVNNFRDVVLNNAALKETNLTLDDLDDIRIKDRNSYEDIFNQLGNDDIAIEMREHIIKHIKFIDIDKLLLLSLNKLEQYVETKELKKEDFNSFYQMCCFIFAKIENAKSSIDTHIELDDSTWEEVKNSFDSKIIDLHYSAKDAEKFICRLSEKGYISKEEFNIFRDELMLGKKKISDFSNEIIYAMELSSEELDKITQNNPENAIALIELNKMKEETILKVYKDEDQIDDVVANYIIKNGKIGAKTAMQLCCEGKISLEVFKDLDDYSEFISKLTIKDIMDKYCDLKSEKKFEDKPELSNMIELYKIFNIEGKSKEELEKEYECIMDEFSKTFENDNDILYFFEHGLLPIDIVAEWCDESKIEEIYNQGKVKIDGEDGLVGLYSRGKIKKELFEKIILNANLSFEQLFEYMKKKQISTEGIISIFKDSDMYRTDLERNAKELLDSKIISQYVYDQLIQRDLKDLEEKAGHGITEREAMKQLRGCEIPWEIQISKKEVREHFKKEETDKPIPPTDGGKSNKIISPIARYEFLKLLKCNIPNISYEKIGEENPFYDYNFYIIQEEILGEEPLRDAIIIIERFFKDREKAMEDAHGDMETALNNVDNWAKDNATYIMNYEDYLVLQGKQKELQETKKRSVVREVEGAIYTANHRSGSWGISVLYKIAQAKAGKSFKKYKGEERSKQVIDWLRTLYNPEELDRILDFARPLDDREEYTYEEKNGTYKLVYTGEDYDDDSDQR